jgi:hypothetical protein
VKVQATYGLQIRGSKPGSGSAGSSGAAGRGFGVSSRLTTAAGGQAQRQKINRPSIFSDDLDDDDDDEVEEGAGGGKDKDAGDKYKKTEIKRVNKHLMEASSRIGQDTAKLYEEALSTDASVFDYDGAYDTFKAESKAAEAASALKAAASTSAPVEYDIVHVLLFICYALTTQKSKYIANLKDMAVVREIEHNRIFERKLMKERVTEDALFGDKDQFVTAAYRDKLQKEKKWEAEDK